MQTLKDVISHLSNAVPEPESSPSGMTRAITMESCVRTFDCGANWQNARACDDCCLRLRSQPLCLRPSMLLAVSEWLQLSTSYFRPLGRRLVNDLGGAGRGGALAMAQDERRLDGSLPTPAPVTRHRNGSASVWEPVFAPFSTPASIKRQRNRSVSVREPPSQRQRPSSAIAMEAPAWRSQFLLPCAGASIPMALDERQRWGWSKIGLPDAGASVTMAVEDGKIGLLDASVFIALMPGIPDAVRTLLTPQNYSSL